MKSVPALVAAALAISGCGAPISPDALAARAGRADGSSPPLTDGGTGATDAGTSFQGEITYTETGYDLLAVDSTGTAYGVNLSGSGAEIWSGSDGRSLPTWSAAPGTPSHDRRTAASPGQRCSRPAPIARSARTASRSWTGRSTSWSTRSSPGPARPSGSGSPRTAAPPGPCSIHSGGTATGTG